MRSTASDKNAQVQYRTPKLKNALPTVLCYNSDRRRTCIGAERTLLGRTKEAAAASISHPSSQHSNQRCTRVLPQVQQMAITLSKCCWLQFSRLRPRHKLTTAPYQQQSLSTIIKTKITTTRHIFISCCSTVNSYMHHLLHKRFFMRSPFLVLVTLYLLCFSHLIGSSSAAPQSCVLCDINDIKDQASNAHAYEEYHFEHQVTRMDAITALKMFNVSDYNEPSGCAMSCSDKVMKYCLGQQFINDHCWCELGHTEEGLPFVPHICYVGDKLYKATVGSCYFYEQVKECCCAPALVKQWRHISEASRQINSGSLLLLNIFLLFFHAACRQKNAF
ncbi:uncharacterized protein [Eurosta solidaginis]|uniref:uncharacterized protein n=1 Tax=Eurosta solidaginis TaxID=178769 RepID=UPI0035311745